MELIKFLKPGWDVRLGRGRIILEAPSEAEGNDLLDSDIEKLEASAANWGLEIVVAWGDCQHPIKISPSVWNCEKWFKFILTQLNEQMINLQVNPSRDSDLALLAYSSEFPVWVTRMTDQKVLLCNQLAIDTQQKDPTELLGESIVPLWDNDPLEVMIEYLQRDQQLTNYENPGYRYLPPTRIYTPTQESQGEGFKPVHETTQDLQGYTPDTKNVDLNSNENTGITNQQSSLAQGQIDWSLYIGKTIRFKKSASWHKGVLLSAEYLPSAQFKAVVKSGEHETCIWYEGNLRICE